MWYPPPDPGGAGWQWRVAPMATTGTHDSRSVRDSSEYDHMHNVAAWEGRHGLRQGRSWHSPWASNAAFERVVSDAAPGRATRLASRPGGLRLGQTPGGNGCTAYSAGDRRSDAPLPCLRPLVPRRAAATSRGHSAVTAQPAGTISIWATFGSNTSCSA